MTLPGKSVLADVQFGRYDTITYTSTNNDLPLDENIYLNHFNMNETTQRQQEQQHFALHAQQLPPQQRNQQTSPLLTNNPTLNQDTKKSPLVMQTTTHQQQRNLVQQCEQMSTQFHTSTASATLLPAPDLALENVMPGIYLTKNFLAWNEENLRTHGFTHIIIIDKHIPELYYPSPIFKLSTENTAVDAFDTYEYVPHPACSSLKFGKEFEAIDLNFGEKSYLTTVLPNCYRAVKFINKALQAGGTILVIDCNGSEQKCLTIIVAYLMYKHNINFSKAFARLKDNYKKADLDRFYMRQLYEYEPILQVQRAQSRGQSCSREMHSAILKRKKVEDNFNYFNDVSEFGNFNGTQNETSDTSEFFSTFNPLSNFNATTTAQISLKQQHSRRNQRQHQQSLASANCTNSDYHNCNDYDAME